ncbi:hypothetical protein D3C77_602760 [compost metagenome]
MAHMPAKDSGLWAAVFAWLVAHQPQLCTGGTAATLPCAGSSTVAVVAARSSSKGPCAVGGWAEIEGLIWVLS